MATGQWFASESGGQGIWALSESAATAPVITAVDPVSGTELQVTWTGTASRYRLDGGTPVTLTDTVSPATISGLSPNTLYAVELDNGDGNWSNSVSEWTDNTGGGGGSLLEITPAAGSLRFTGYVPTVARTANQWVAPGAGSLVFTGYVPTVERTGSRDVAPASGALRFTGYAPTVEVLAGSQTIEPAAGALRFTGYVPTISVSVTVRSTRSTGPGYSERRRMRWENEEVEKPAAADLASISMILATLLEVGVFNG